MADAAVEFLLENLKQLLLYHTHLIHDAMNQVGRLENRLRLFKAFLEDVPKQQRREDEVVRELIRRIRYAVYEAEDIIDAYVTQAAQTNNNNFFHGAIQGSPKIAGIIKEVDAVIEKIQDIYANKSKIDFARIEDGGTDENEEGQVEETNVVGLEDEIEKLKGYLFEESPELDVISIVGMPGLGKTIMAEKIFNDPDIRYEFVTRIWVYVSQEFTNKDIFLAILEEFTILTEDIKSKTDQVLADLVVSYLENERFLLVMDDVWSCEDWDKLQVALPKSNKMGKVLITSRQSEVGRHVNHRRNPHMLRFLNVYESILLLQMEVFREPMFPPELEVEGRLIAERCYGLPLAIVVIAGILVKEVSSDMTAMKTTWKDVYECLDTFRLEHELNHMENILRLSYERLPHHLRECYLYFGMFPEDFEIPAWKLIRLWIAEGFIQYKQAASLEETAENYLEELIIRKLVRAEKFKLDGKVKTCRIHDMLRDFCLNEAGIKREGFLQEIKMSSDGGFQPPVTMELKFRRLCIHSYILNFVASKPYGRSVRSFICSSRDEMTMPIEYTSATTKGFQLLRILDVKPIKFTSKLPRYMFQLLHLRYLVLSVNLQVLPSAFSKLWNIQTLVFDTSSRTLEIRADLLNMMQLRLFKTNASAALPKTSRSSKRAHREIHTLGTISPESCTKDVFDRVRNLKKLGVRGKLALLLDGKNESLDSLGNLGNLEKLKLLNDVFPIPPSGVQLCGLPPPYKFPPKLKILTLSRTSLDWRHMSILGSLERLEVLKLKDKAFVGDIWEVTDGGFRLLEVLHIERTNLKNWLASHHHFPRLKHLQLKHCDDLQRVPMELADVPSFLKLDLFHSKRAAASALQIEEKKRQDNQLPGNLERQFKLSIFPWRNEHTSF